MKKNLHPITEEKNENITDIELLRKKKAKKNNPETDDDSPSADHSSFVALVKASNLQKDTLELPKDVRSSKGLKRICRKIILTDERKRSWTLGLRFNTSSDTFSISRGWTNFCHENDKKEGDFFIFKSVEDRETPLLLICRATSSAQKSSKESLLVECSGGKNLRCKDSTSQSLNRFMTLRLTRAGIKKCRQYLSLPFMRENGLDKPGMITLVGKDGSKCLANRCQQASGNMCLGKGWKEFAKANGLKIGESFTLELIWKGTTPTLSLFDTELRSHRRQQGKKLKDSEAGSIFTEPSSENKTKKDENNKFVTLTLLPEDVRACKLDLPSQFMRANGIDKLGKITMMGKDGLTYSAFRLSCDGFVAVGIDWKDFCETNGVQTGESFTLEFTNEQDATPVFKFLPTVMLLKT